MNFKVGDRVRVVSSNYSGPRLQVGATGVIESVALHCNQVRIDDHTAYTWSFMDRELELAPPVPKKSPAEHILAKLIEAKREQRATNLAYGTAQRAASEATERVAALERQLSVAIHTEVEKK